MNLGNYESLALEASYQDDIPEGVKQSEFISEMFDKVEKILFKEFAKSGVSVD